MRKSRTAPPPVKGPPQNIEAAALLIRKHAVKLYDQQDGKGVDWAIVSAALFKAGIDAMDQMPEGQAKEKLAWRVHAAAEKRATGGYAVRDDQPEPSFPDVPIEPGADPGGGRPAARKGPRPPH